MTSACTQRTQRQTHKHIAWIAAIKRIIITITLIWMLCLWNGPNAPNVPVCVVPTGAPAVDRGRLQLPTPNIPQQWRGFCRPSAFVFLQCYQHLYTCAWQNSKIGFEPYHLFKMKLICPHIVPTKSLIRLALTVYFCAAMWPLHVWKCQVRSQPKGI